LVDDGEGKVTRPDGLNFNIGRFFRKLLQTVLKSLDPPGELRADRRERPIGFSVVGFRCR
jgi:hypothetical protein